MIPNLSLDSENPLVDHIGQKFDELHPLGQRAVFQGLQNIMQGGGTAPAEAAPVAPMAGPAATLRSLGPAPAPTEAATPAPSTLAAPARPARPIAPPESPEQQRRMGELNRLETSPSGVGGIKSPWARVPLQILDAVGQGFFPGLERAIPGTEGHHQRLIGEQQASIKQGEAVESEQAKRAAEAATTEHTQAETEAIPGQTALRTSQAKEAEARAASLLHPEAKTEFEAWQRDPKNVGKSVMDWFREKAAAQPSHQEGELPLGDRVPQLNQAMKARYQVLHPGQPLPEHYTVSPAATQKDFDRIDKLMEAEERASGTKAQQDESHEMRKQTAAIAQGNRADAERDREAARFGKPHQAALTAANAQLEKIQEARAMINGSAEAQALGIPKVLTALVSGQGSGVRITQSEQDAIAKARGIGGSIEGKLREWSGKGKLTPEQQQQIGHVLDDVQAIIQKKQGIVNDTLDRINSAPNRAEIVKADTDARKQLQELEKSPAGAGGAPIVQHSKSTGAYRYSTDGGKTWQPGQPPNQNK